MRGGGAASSDPGALGSQAANGRCGSTPTEIVSAASVAAPDAGDLETSLGAFVILGSDLVYTTGTIRPAAPGLADSFVAGTLMRAPLDGGAASQVASGALFRPPVSTATGAVVVEESSLEGDGNAILSIAEDGGAPTVIVTLPNDDVFVNGIAADDRFVYFSDYGTEAAPLNGTADAGMITMMFQSADGLGVFGHKLIFGLPQGAIESLPLPPRPNSPVTMLGTGAPGGLTVLPCGPSSCWLLESQGPLVEIDQDGGVLATLDANVVGGASIAAAAFDGSQLYVLSENVSGGSALSRIPAAGGSPVVLVTGPTASPGGVAVDDACVYWSNAEGIFSLSKTAEGPFAQ